MLNFNLNDFLAVYLYNIIIVLVFICLQCNGGPRERFRGNYVFEPFVQSDEDDTFHRGVRLELYKRANRLNRRHFPPLEFQR